MVATQSRARLMASTRRNQAGQRLSLMAVARHTERLSTSKFKAASFLAANTINLQLMRTALVVLVRKVHHESIKKRCDSHSDGSMHFRNYAGNEQ